MALTINHQTNDISATSGSVTIDGAAAGGGGGPVTSGLKTAGTSLTQVPPIDLGYYTGSGLLFSSSVIYFVPWVAPADGTLDGITIYLQDNIVSSSGELGLGIYSHSSGPSSRLSYGTLDPNGIGDGWKSVLRRISCELAEFLPLQRRCSDRLGSRRGPIQGLRRSHPNGRHPGLADKTLSAPGKTESVRFQPLKRLGLRYFRQKRPERLLCAVDPGL